MISDFTERELATLALQYSFKFYYYSTPIDNIYKRQPYFDGHKVYPK